MEGPAAVLQQRLLAWYDVHKRDLPWRRDQDPYRVWLSEVMSQQTRVDTVVPYFLAWLDRFPTVDALAEADEEAVMAAWAGLGYYGRARRLHAAAKIVRRDGFPATRDAWRALPGVGPYIAGAVASIVHGESVPAVDGNVHRVMARLVDADGCIDERAGARAIEEVAATLVPAARPGDWNQAVMELGATVCRPIAPRCGDCPLAPSCMALQNGTIDERPVRKPKRRPVEEAMHFALLRQGSRAWMVPRPDDGLLAGTWMLPGGTIDEPLEDLVRLQTGADVRVEDRIGEARHVFSHRIWNMKVRPVTTLDHEPHVGRWVDIEAPDVALSTAARRALASLLATP